MVGVLLIQTSGSYFDLAEDGREALVIPVANELPLFTDWPDSPSPVYNSLAFFPDKPDQWFLRVGYAWVLGGVNLRVAQTPFAVNPLRVSRTPLSWLQGGCDGVVLLKAGMARSLLAGLGRIKGEDESHAAELHQLPYAAPPDLPAIYFKEGQKAA